MQQKHQRANGNDEQRLGLNVVPYGYFNDVSNRNNHNPHNPRPRPMVRRFRSGFGNNQYNNIPAPTRQWGNNTFSFTKPVQNDPLRDAINAFQSSSIPLFGAAVPSTNQHNHRSGGRGRGAGGGSNAGAGSGSARDFDSHSRPYRRITVHRARTPETPSDSDEDSDDWYDALSSKSSAKLPDLSKWKANDIYEWIMSISKEKFGRYKDLKSKLEENEMTGNELKELEIEDIIDSFGIKKYMDRKYLYNKIQSILPFKDREANKVKKKKKVEEDKETAEDIPEELLDPITYELMSDPVICTKSGHTYERKTIEDWIESNGADPITRQKIKKKHLTPNRTVKAMIESYLKEKAEKKKNGDTKK